MQKSRVNHKPVVLYESPQELTALVSQYEKWLEVKNFTADTLKANRERLKYFMKWSEGHGICKACEVTREFLERYQQYLAQAINLKNGQPLSTSTRSSYATTVIKFFRWLASENRILVNPGDGMRVAGHAHVLPRNVLTHQETEQIIAQPDVTTARGIRDRAILETLYSTGIRAGELIHLTIRDLDLEQGLVAVMEGKGRKDRLIPIGQRAILWLEKYLREVRYILALGKNEATLFLTMYGKPFRRGGFSSHVRRYVLSANIGKKGSCHIFRHAMATGMLENGADIRYIQEMLGHSSPSTTEIYTKVSIQKIKEVHSHTHPGEKENAHA